MLNEYLNYIPFSEALKKEQEAYKGILAGHGPRILGFETGPVITLGARGRAAEDLQWSEEEIQRRGFEIHRLERGGQATLHNPGQLVIFPVMDIRSIGARAWVALLLKVTEQTLAEFGKTALCRPVQPGLYSENGKVAAVGIRVRQGVSTHGIAINIKNDLADFQSIRPCGVSNAPVDRLGAEFSLEAVFSTWLKNFRNAVPLGLTSSRNLTNLECSSTDVRL